MNSYIWITTQFEGFHKYPSAPDDVSFLRERHRHIFHVRVYLEIFHNDREVEFILFKRFVESIIKNNDFDFKSCEMISDDLYKNINYRFPNRKVIIEVSEDNENGSRKEYA